MVPLPAAVTAAAPAALGDVPSLTDLTRSGLSPITSAVIAALVATVVVWILGLVPAAGPDRPRPGRRRPPGRTGPAGSRQTRRRTVTTRPRMVASSPGIGSYAGLCGSSHTCPSRRL